MGFLVWESGPGRPTRVLGPIPQERRMTISPDRAREPLPRSLSPEARRRQDFSPSARGSGTRMTRMAQRLGVLSLLLATTLGYSGGAARAQSSVAPPPATGPACALRGTLRLPKHLPIYDSAGQSVARFSGGESPLLISGF